MSLLGWVVVMTAIAGVGGTGLGGFVGALLQSAVQLSQDKHRGIKLPCERLKSGRVFANKVCLCFVPTSSSGTFFHNLQVIDDDDRTFIAWRAGASIFTHKLA